MDELYATPLRTLHLYAGGGGGILGDLLFGHRPVCAVEINPYCRKVLTQRQEDGILPWFPIWKSVKNFDGKQWNGVVDMVCGGFPCQPFSRAGKQKGTGDERNLWPDTLRIIREVGPAAAFLENVPGLLSFDYFGEIIGNLAESGFDAEWGVVSAGECGAPHLRERLWILAYDPRRIEQSPQWQFWRRENSQPGGVYKVDPDSVGERCSRRVCSGVYEGKEARRAKFGTPCQEDAHDQSIGCGSGGHGRLDSGSSRQSKQILLQETTDAAILRLCGSKPERDAPKDGGGGRRNAFQPYQMGVESLGEWWAAEPDVGRVADGVAQRVERLKALGNGQVPVVVVRAFLMLAYRAGLVDRGRDA